MAMFGYGRVTRAGQDGEDQRLALERAGYGLAWWFADDGIDVDVPAAQRPQFQGILRRIAPHDALLVCTLDCLGCDAHDIVAVIEALGRREVEVIVLALGSFDLAGGAGRPVLAALSAVAALAREAMPRSGAIVPAAPGRSRGRPACTTQTQRALIIERHRAGESISALARAEKLSRASIMRIVRTTGMQ